MSPGKSMSTRMPRIRFLILALMSLTLIALQAHAQTSRRNPQRELTVTGTSVLGPLVSDIAGQFERGHPGVKINVQSGGSGKGLAAIRAGTSDIAMLPRALRDGERDLFAFPIARDGVAVLVNRENAVKNISSRQLKDVLIGRVTNWKPLGGRESRLNL